MTVNFGKGLLAELSGKSTRDGAPSFGLENAIGSIIHLGAGWGIGKAVRAVTKKPFKGLLLSKMTKKTATAASEKD